MESVHDHVAAFVTAFNAGDPAALENLYAAEGVVIPRPGHTASGPQRPAVLAHLMSFGHPMRAAVRHVYPAGDIALAIVDWSIPAMRMSGSATDVLRRNPDGTVRYLVDNPFGTA